MIVQIYATTSTAEALALAELGVDQVGFVAGEYGEVYGELSFAQARQIAAALRGKAASSALTMSIDPAEVLRMAATVQPDIIHISSDTEAIDVATVAKIRQALPASVLLMKAIQVGGSETVELALRFVPVSDILLLDTKVSGMPGVGATGITHDWDVSREIVKQVGDTAKVILAGGLTPDNVAAAISIVQPWGVDSNTRTNIPGDPVKKDLNRVRAFVEQAKGIKIRN